MLILFLFCTQKTMSKKRAVVQLSRFDYWNVVLIGTPMIAMGYVIYRDRFLKPEWEKKEKQMAAALAAATTKPNGEMYDHKSALDIPMSTPKY